MKTEHKENSSIMALVHGLSDGGCSYTSNFPGFNSEKIFEALGGKYISFNERDAYLRSYGASLAGKRSCVSFKNVGLNVAADPFLNSLLSGVNAGLVLIVTDDMEVVGSQSRQDSRSYRDFFGGLWFEPASIQSAYSIGYQAFDLSEKFDVPVVIRLTNQFFDLGGTYKKSPVKRITKEPVKNPEKFVIHPTNYKQQMNRMAEKNRKISQFVEEFAIPYDRLGLKNFNECSGLSILFGCCTKELLEQKEKKNTLQVETYPIPQSLIKQVCKSGYPVSVFEQGDEYGYRLVKECLSLPSFVSSESHIPTDSSSGYRIWGGLEKMFKALSAINPSYVVSDLTQFTRETTNTIESCLCLGSAIPVVVGMEECGVSYPWAVVGDVSLMHGQGADLLKEASAKNKNFGVIIIDNNGAWCTGGQSTVLTLEKYLENIKTETVNYNNIDEVQFKDIFESMRGMAGVSVLIVQTYESET